MQRIPISLTLLTLLFSGGCVSKQQHESVQAELLECQEIKAQAEAQVISWEQRFDREADRWESVGVSIRSQLPEALSELDAERERIVELVPEQVKGEVERYLDEYFTTVMTGFDRMAADNREVKMQLTATQKVLENLGADTRAVSTKIDTTLEDERVKRAQERQAREAVASRIAEVITLLSQFDSTKVNCKGCKDRLKLKVKERDELSRFHGDVTAQLSQIQAFATAPYELTAIGDPGAESAVEGGVDAGESEGSE